MGERTHQVRTRVKNSAEPTCAGVRAGVRLAQPGLPASLSQFLWLMHCMCHRELLRIPLGQTWGEKVYVGHM